MDSHYLWIILTRNRKNLDRKNLDLDLILRLWSDGKPPTYATLPEFAQFHDLSLNKMRGWNFINDACLCDIFTKKFSKICLKIVHLKQTLCKWKYFQNSLSLWEFPQKRYACFTYKNSLKNLEQIVTVVFTHFILIRMHDWVIATEM